MSKIKIFSLGGLNENGKNMYVVDVDEQLYIFDAGLKYADDSMLGIDYIIPNYDYLLENKKRIVGFFISNGHAENMGAIKDLIEDFKDVNIYGSKFTLESIKIALEGKVASLVEVKPHVKINVGKNSVFPIALTSEFPDSLGYVINTEDGAIVYTSNFMFDATMKEGYKTDIGKLAYIGKKGVLALLSESVYSDKKGYTSPKHRIISVIDEELTKTDDRILCNIFTFQIFRISQILKAVSKTDRKVVVMGKKLEQIIKMAIDNGYIDFDKKRILPIKNINDKNIFVLIGDEREKVFLNLHRILKGYDKFTKFNSTDTVLFASPVYPGTEKRSSKILDNLSRMDVKIVTLSGKKFLDLHASTEDLMMMINLMNPKYYVPVSGEYRSQVLNKKVALVAGMEKRKVFLKLNGQVMEFENGEIVSNSNLIKVDDILVDGSMAGDVGELVLKDRETLSDNGVVIVTATIDYKTKRVLAGPEILTRGFIYVKENTDLIDQAKEISNEVITEFTKDGTLEFNKIKTGVRNRLGKFLYKQTECRPMILVVLQEV
jgi:ribonuclease J